MKPRSPGRQRPTRHPSRRTARIKQTQPQNMKYLLAGSSMLAVVGLLVDVGSLFRSTPPQDICEEIIQPESVLSRDELSQLLSIPERDSREAVRRIISAPYCQMPSIEIRSGILAEREAYPLEFDPQTWLVILYEGDEYAGYAFSFQH
ncbi:MAG: hypothetical protein ACFE0J_11310 [Elainellaceae cyanobacterium]